MRPRFRGDVRCVPSDDGVYLHAGHGACRVKGGRAAESLRRLIPRLTGERTLDELTAGLDGAQGVRVRGLVGSLVEAGFVVDAQDDDPHGLSREELETYSVEIAFVRYRLASAERRFERLRQARIALRGSGPVAEALLHAGLQSGWRNVQVHAPEGEVRALKAAADRALRDARQSVSFAPPDAAPAAPDVVLDVSTDRNELLAAARALIGTGSEVGQALIDEAAEEAWLVPVGPPEEAGARRMPTGAPPPTGRSPVSALLTGAVPGMLGSRLALSRFSRLAGLAVEGEAPTRVDLRTLDARMQPVARERPAEPAAHAPSSRSPTPDRPPCTGGSPPGARRLTGTGRRRSPSATWHGSSRRPGRPGRTTSPEQKRGRPRSPSSSSSSTPSTWRRAATGTWAGTARSNAWAARRRRRRSGWAPGTPTPAPRSTAPPPPSSWRGTHGTTAEQGPAGTASNRSRRGRPCTVRRWPPPPSDSPPASIPTGPAPRRRRHSGRQERDGSPSRSWPSAPRPGTHRPSPGACPSGPIGERRPCPVRARRGAARVPGAHRWW